MKPNAMKKSILFILFLLTSTASKSTVFNVWYIENDTTISGQSFKVYVNGAYSSGSDTGRVFIKDLSTSTFVELYKVSIIDLLQTTPTGQNNTYEITVAIPSGYTENCEVFSNYATAPRLPVYVRANYPDLLIIGGFGPFSGESGFSTYFKVKWTYISMSPDSLELILNSIIYKKIALYDLREDSIVRFSLPDSAGSYALTANYILNNGTWIDYTVTETPDPPVTNILDPLCPKKEVTYYTILGEKIDHPSEGLFIWRSQYGQSGKILITP
jgi:hypothetical protein